MPIAETLHTSWRHRRGMFGNIIIKPWANWQESITSDVNPLRVRYELQPRRICSQSIRAPPTVNIRSSGTHAERWEQWAPSTHDNPYPIGLESSVVWARYSDRPGRTLPYNGRGAVSAHSAAVLGCSTLSDCSHMRRSFGPESELASLYDTGIQEEFSDDGLRSLALEGGNIIRRYGGLYPALAGIRGSEMRHLEPQIDYEHTRRESSPAQYHAPVGILDQWIRVEYSEGVGVIPRGRGLPRNHTQKTNSVLLAAKMRKGVRALRMFVWPTQAISPDTPIDATPTTTVEKKNPDRTISTDRRAIADLRRINLGFNPAQYYPVRVPAVESLGRLLVSMAVSFSSIPIEMAKTRYRFGVPIISAAPTPVVINAHGTTRGAL